MTEYMVTDKKSRTNKHLNASENCKSLSDGFVFVIDSASTKFALKLKEGMHIKWSNPILNNQVNNPFSSICV